MHIKRDVGKTLRPYRMEEILIGHLNEVCYQSSRIKICPQVPLAG